MAILMSPRAGFCQSIGTLTEAHCDSKSPAHSPQPIAWFRYCAGTAGTFGSAASAAGVSIGTGASSATDDATSTAIQRPNRRGIELLLEIFARSPERETPKQCD